MRKWLLSVVVLAVMSVSAGENILTDGKFRVGCNYWASHNAMRMWRDWRPDVVERDFADLKAHGIAILRIFPLWSDFQPIVRIAAFANQPSGVAWADDTMPDRSGVDGEMVRRFASLCDMAERHHLKLVVSLVTGWMSGRTFVPPALTDKDLLTDPEAIMWEVRYVRRIVSALRKNPAIAAWDLGNECNCLQAPVTRFQAWNWVNAIAGAIRQADPTHPVVGGMHGLSSEAVAPWPIRDQGELVDVLTTHPYPLFTPECAREPYDTMRGELHASAESLLYAGLSGRPCFVEEAGDLGRTTASMARAAASLRCALFSSWANGLGAYLWWCAYDFDHLGYPPYEWSAFEGELGLFASDRKPKRTLLELKAFSDFLKGLPFERLPARRVDAVTLVSEREDAWKGSFGSFLLSRQAGFDVAFVGAESAELPDAKLYLMPSSRAYTRSAWNRVYAKVAAGATLVLSRGEGCRYPNFRERTGCEIDVHFHEPRGGSFAFDSNPAEKISLNDGRTTRIMAHEAKVLAKTSAGEPVVTDFSYGKGRVLYVNFPIEADSVLRRGVFAGKTVDPRYRVYQKAAELAGIRRLVRKGDCPQVGLTEHSMPDGKTVCVAVNYAPDAVSCPVEIDGTVVRVFRGEMINGALAIRPNDAMVLEVAHRTER